MEIMFHVCVLLLKTPFAEEDSSCKIFLKHFIHSARPGWKLNTKALQCDSALLDNDFFNKLENKEIFSTNKVISYHYFSRTSFSCKGCNKSTHGHWIWRINRWLIYSPEYAPLYPEVPHWVGTQVSILAIALIWLT